MYHTWYSAIKAVKIKVIFISEYMASHADLSFPFVVDINMMSSMKMLLKLFDLYLVQISVKLFLS